MRAWFLLAAALPLAGADAPTFPRGQWFRDHFGSPGTRVELRPPSGISNHIQDGKLELSLNDYIELTLENNTDIALSRLQIAAPENAILRAVGVFDPSLQASFTNTRSTLPTTSALQGAGTLRSVSEPLDVSYQQLLPTGTSVGVSFDSLRSTSNNTFSTYNPALNTSLAFSFDHPLLRNRNASLTRLNILIARSNLKISRFQLNDQISNLLAAAENVYWDVVEARENVALQSKFLELRKAALERAQKQLDAGALLPLDIFQPKADYASAQLAMIQSRQLLARRENALRQQIGADLVPDLRSLPIVLTEPLSIANVPVPEREEAVRKARDARPDRQAAAATLDVDTLGIRSATQSLRPSLSLTGSYTTQGVGGIFNQLSDPFSSDPVITRIPGGLGDALSQLLGFGFPVYSVGLRMNLPLRDRVAAANLSDSQVRKTQDALQLRKVEQNLRAQVLNAIDDLEAADASVAQAGVARDFAEKRFSAEQKKYELGVTQLFFVLDAQTQLNQAENDVLRQSINYRRALINLYLMSGELLVKRGVRLN